MEKLKTNLYQKDIHESDKKPTYGNPKHTENPNTSEWKRIKQRNLKKNLEQSAEKPKEAEDEAQFPTPLIDKILYTTIPLIRTAFQKSLHFLVRLRFTMHTAAKDEVKAINVHLFMLQGPREFEDILEEREI